MKNPAFTLVELLVTIVIIGILATISVSQFSHYQNKARNAHTISVIGQYIKAIRLYEADNAGKFIDFNVDACLGEGYQDATCWSLNGGTNEVYENSAFNNAIRPYIEAMPMVPYEYYGIILNGNSGLTRGAIIRRRKTTFTLDGNLIQYIISYYLYGEDQSCGHSIVIKSGTWPNFITEEALPYTYGNVNNKGNTSCVIAVFTEQ